MKKILLALVLLSAMLALTVPVLAKGPIPTGVFIPEGAGDPPIIKAKWELPDEDPTKPGTQILPPMSYQGTVPVTYWVIATDPNGFDNLRDAYVDVWHPDGSFKYQISLPEVIFDCTNPDDPILLDIIAALTYAYNNDLVTFGINPDTQVPYTLEEVIGELEQCSAKAYRGTSDLDYHQMCGEDGYPYEVWAYAFDKENSQSEYLVNTFEYICLAGIELDFDSMDFGRVMVSSWDWIEGNYIWDTPDGPACDSGTGCRPPTIRNIGNTPVIIKTWFDDMDFGTALPTCGQSPNSWCVRYDARLGLNSAVLFDPGTNPNNPNEWATLPGTLWLCNTTKISFSIHVYKTTSTGEHTGQSFIEPEAVPIPWWFECETDLDCINKYDTGWVCTGGFCEYPL